uniref:Uncharacterized protein n=1 Tax=Meloidogyne enterolobii TaxID=390850 RepID=A0A6V7VJV2_MELEN|nr:unnamed protein product [Meloidogyne enterolobii]
MVQVTKPKQSLNKSENLIIKLYLVERGCGDKTSWTEKNVQVAKCQNKHLCNTKEFFENKLFCLTVNIGKITNEISKMSEPCGEDHKACYHQRSEVLYLGCGKCNDKYCTNCKTNFCNVEEKGYKKCYTNTKNMCYAKPDETCFMERTKNNKVNKGCGNCPTKTCITCNKHECNDGKNLPYYCLDYDGKSPIECKKSDCYIDKCRLILGLE